MRSDVCTLISLYVDGKEQKRKELDVFCGKKSVVRSERYSAYAVGLRPRFVLIVDPGDYEAASGPGGEFPSMVRYGAHEYNIYHDYQINESTVELTVG